jgi:hypothetical protein
MREPQKVERLGFPFSSLIPVVLGRPPELNLPRFVWVQLQPELSQPFPIFRQEAVCFSYSWNPTTNIIIGVSDDNDIASRALSAPDVHPQVEHVMQIDVRKPGDIAFAGRVFLPPGIPVYPFHDSVCR